MLKTKDIHQRLKDIEDYLLDEYKESREETKRDWRTYEQRLMHRIKEAIRNLEPLIEEAVKTIKIHRGKGRKPELSLKQKVILLLLKELFGKSNRMMASMMAIFSLLSGIDISYKSVERLYSDPEVELAVYNLHVLVLKKKEVNHVDASGDGTGYSLTIKKHYASEIQKRKDEAKTGGTKTFVYSFKMLDLKTRMYVAYGMSFKSEKKAFEKAMNMLEKTGIKLESVRLDKYFSHTSDIDRFEESTVYILPKKNSTLRGSQKWKKIMQEFVLDTFVFLEQYYMRNNSEAEFSVDKRWFGWKVEQRREDRINMALTCGNVWHNLFKMHA